MPKKPSVELDYSFHGILQSDSSAKFDANIARLPSMEDSYIFFASGFTPSVEEGESVEAVEGRRAVDSDFVEDRPEAALVEALRQKWSKEATQEVT
ncbi:hypothetical protein HPP92_026036 [Vanilla planifolia]|uniref:Uncharacterized protein n=1 Tax=Vanilla planifolia TaxID=51239 RepID=A0A835U7Y8_VANPL|nr:hypothetical protein HPP92_026309 [Vanilla planifolia]KAG0451778.1 hypothetical protein HPP92_026036 [Vanilla planifolia]